MRTIITKEQLKAVMLIQGIMWAAVFAVGFFFWRGICPEGFDGCLPNEPILAGGLLALVAFFRPILCTPTVVLAYFAGNNFDILPATILTALGAACSAMLVYIPGHLLGIHAVRPWLSANMPATWEVLCQNQLRMTILLRWVTVLPFDVISLLSGVAGFKPKWVFLGTFVGILPESYMFVALGHSPVAGGFWDALLSLGIFGLASLVPFLVFEFLFRKRGSSLWSFARRAYYEAVYEIRINNEIIKKRDYDSQRTPVILVYGFFSSRKALTVMERLLTQRGFQVMSFNLGGVLGVFFTRGIKEAAAYVDHKIKRQMARHNFKAIHMVGHSKGGLVALWWLLKLGGHRYCEKVITMGTPFRGSRLTYLALISPLGFVWRDLWQMRPRSQFLLELKNAVIPKHVMIYNLYSRKDMVAGVGGDFQCLNKPANMVSVPMHHVEHFEFLYRRDVADTIARLLREAPIKGNVGLSATGTEDGADVTDSDLVPAADAGHPEPDHQDSKEASRRDASKPKS